MGRISTMWAEPEWYPTLRWNKEGYYGFEGGAAVEVLRFEGAGCSCYQDSEG
ncbi:hypothetical protein HanXRQr2_Chr12g0561141 [Helianthus annuus]|uniref:Uncharacterized protein n=1 Tax=Helianthus annuus TaxID=4232 RepID=A0A251T466_HELAN|nr:hypothetical protein HanXRQr2_Chr12g0561141 [Helianthus annuus]